MTNFNFADPETLAEKSGPALLAYYNSIVAAFPETGFTTVKRFADREAAFSRIDRLVGAVSDGGLMDKPVSVQPDQPPSGDTPSVETSVSTEQEPKMAKKTTKTARAPKTPREPKTKREDRFPEDGVIVVLAKENPRRGEAAKRFELYKPDMTVAQYSKKFEGGRKEALVHLRWDLGKGFIKIK